MSRIITVGAAQLGPIAPEESRVSAVNRMIELLKQAKSRGVKLVVFPELALTTFFPRYYEQDISKMDHHFERGDMPTPETRPLFEKAKEFGIGFYLGYAELTEDGHRFNTSILVDDTGKIVGKYRKVHLPGHSEYDGKRPWQHLEKRYFEPGDLGFPVWRSMGGVMGMCICNDRRWPETYRVMGLQGVEMVLLGYNTPVHNPPAPEHDRLGWHHNTIVMQSGAYQNATWVVGVAKGGVEEGVPMICGTQIIAPSGETVAQALTEADELITAVCDLDVCQSYKRSVFNFAMHREPEHYGLITATKGAVSPADGERLERAGRG